MKGLVVLKAIGDAAGKPAQLNQAETVKPMLRTRWLAHVATVFIGLTVTMTASSATSCNSCQRKFLSVCKGPHTVCARKSVAGYKKCIRTSSFPAIDGWKCGSRESDKARKKEPSTQSGGAR